MTVLRPSSRTCVLLADELVGPGAEDELDTRVTARRARRDALRATQHPPGSGRNAHGDADAMPASHVDGVRNQEDARRMCRGAEHQRVAPVRDQQTSLPAHVLDAGDDPEGGRAARVPPLTQQELAHAADGTREVPQVALRASTLPGARIAAQAGKRRPGPLAVGQQALGTRQAGPQLRRGDPVADLLDGPRRADGAAAGHVRG